MHSSTSTGTGTSFTTSHPVEREPLLTKGCLAGVPAIADEEQANIQVNGMRETISTNVINIAVVGRLSALANYGLSASGGHPVISRSGAPDQGMTNCLVNVATRGMSIGPTVCPANFQDLQEEWSTAPRQ